MNEKEIERFRELLVKQKQELLQAERASKEMTKPVQLDQCSVGRLTRMDAMQSQAMALEAKRRRNIQLTRIAAAMERLEEGEYGYCGGCGEQINKRRLEFDPATPFCVDCAETL